MATNDDFIPVEAIESGARRRVRTHKRIAIGAAAVVAVAALATVLENAGNETARPAAPVVPLSMDEKLQVLVDRGLTPRQALEPAPLTMKQKLQDLVDKGLIPRQAFEPAPLTMDEKLRDLVNRGLIPRQALEEAPVAIIFGPAHPLGAPDIGIPCSELVYTRC
jgi:hypothetical protein